MEDYTEARCLIFCQSRLLIKRKAHENIPVTKACENLKIRNGIFLNLVLSILGSEDKFMAFKFLDPHECMSNPGR